MYRCVLISQSERDTDRLLELKRKFQLPTFCFAVSASLQAALYISIVCFSSSFSLLISASTSSCNFIKQMKIYVLSCIYLQTKVHRLMYVHVYALVNNIEALQVSIKKKNKVKYL